MGSNPTLSAILRQGFGWRAIQSLCVGGRAVRRLGEGRQAIQPTPVWYVYILRSATDGKLYIGSTVDLTRRLQEHNKGECNSTRHRRPLELEAYIAVRDEFTARSLEKYLKSGSGIATLWKRILTSEVQRT